MNGSMMEKRLLEGKSPTLFSPSSGVPQIRCNTCEVENTFSCGHYVDCPVSVRRCMTLAIRKYL